MKLLVDTSALLALAFRDDRNHQAAVAAARSLFDSRRYELLFVDADLVRAALELMVRFGDKRLSLTDCTSFELMDRLALEAAFALDTDFRDCGYGWCLDGRSVF